MSFKLPNDWQWMPFEKLLAEPLRNGIYKKKEFHGRGCKIINMGELFAYPRLKDGVEMKRVELNERELEKSILQNGDLIFARRSLTAEGAGKCSIIISLDETTTFESSIIRARLNSEITNPEYYYYLFNSPFGKWLLGTILRQVAVAGITGSDLAKLEVPVPPKDVQDKLVVTGRILDDKIEKNRQINQTLESMAQAIFQSWFVDFDPVKAKIAAREQWQTLTDAERTEWLNDILSKQAYLKTCLSELSANNEQSASEILYLNIAAMTAISSRDETSLAGMSADEFVQLYKTASLFPERLVDSELGEIPEGWEVKLTGDVMDVRDGTHDSPKRSEYGFPLVTSKHITSGTLEIRGAYLISEEDYKKINKRSRVDQYDILITMIGTVGISYLVMQKDVNFSIKNIGLFKTSEVKELKGYFYFLLKSPQMKAYLEARLVGTTQKYLSLKTLRSLDIFIPHYGLLESFNSLVNPKLESIYSLLQENLVLEELRDSLLPKLLSGELDVTSLNELADIEPAAMDV